MNTINESLGGAVEGAVKLAIVPAAVMWCMSVLMFSVKAPVRLVAALQHLAAGIVLSAVSVELVPIIRAAPATVSSVGGIVVGFFVGIGIFLLLGIFCEVDNDDDDDDVDDVDDVDENVKGIVSNNVVTVTRASSSRGLFSRRQSSMKNLSTGLSLPTTTRTSTHTTTTTSTSSTVEKINFWRVSESIDNMRLPLLRPAPAYPVALAVAVFVDSFVDGFLIGISSASGATTGVVMTVALTIEMGFLGLTFSSSMRNQPLLTRFLSVSGGPITLLLGGVAGSAGAHALSFYPALHIGLVSFGVAALLYLVTEELLLEAHEGLESTGAGHVWWVDLCFFIGFLLSFLMEKFADQQGA